MNNGTTGASTDVGWACTPAKAACCAAILIASRISGDKTDELVVVVRAAEANSPDADAVLPDGSPRSLDDELLSVDRGITHNKMYEVELVE